MAQKRNNDLWDIKDLINDIKNKDSDLIYKDSDYWNIKNLESRLEVHDKRIKAFNDILDELDSDKVIGRGRIDPYKSSSASSRSSTISRSSGASKRKRVNVQMKKSFFTLGSLIKLFIILWLISTCSTFIIIGADEKKVKEEKRIGIYDDKKSIRDHIKDVDERLVVIYDQVESIINDKKNKTKETKVKQKKGVEEEKSVDDSDIYGHPTDIY